MNINYWIILLATWELTEQENKPNYRVYKLLYPIPYADGHSNSHRQLLHITSNRLFRVVYNKLHHQNLLHLRHQWSLMANDENLRDPLYLAQLQTLENLMLLITQLLAKDTVIRDYEWQRLFPYRVPCDHPRLLRSHPLDDYAC